MIDWTWIATTSTTMLMVLLSALGIYLVLLVLNRITGVRTFAKMSGFEFAITVAFGSLLAATIVAPTPTLLTGSFAMFVLFGIQYSVSKSRRFSKVLEQIVDNRPLLVMAKGVVIPDHLDSARMSEDDLRSNLRLAGISHPKQVFAVVFETSGDVSVIKVGDDVDPWMFDCVRGADQLGLTGLTQDVLNPAT